jgi:N-acetyl-gamma-glutamyl-phosphate reductase
MNDTANTMISVSVVGASGYAGGELVRLLANHPCATIASLHARGRSGNPLGDEFPHLAPLGLTLEDGEPGKVDVIFLTLPAGQSAELATRRAAAGATVIDVGSDLRLHDAAAYPTWYGYEHPAPDALAGAVYGLTELARDRVRGARLIANPGCYPTAALLALLPLAGQLTGHVIVDAKSGVSGAGRGAGRDFLFTELDGSTKAYALGGHRHSAEIVQELGATGADIGLTFVPHLVPQARGILTTCFVELRDDLSDEELRTTLTRAYPDAPFVHVVDAPPSTKQTWGTNHAFLHARRTGPRRAVLVAAIDNMGKGAAGQAIQNMNVALGIDETAGLTAVAVYP